MRLKNICLSIIFSVFFVACKELPPVALGTATPFIPSNEDSALTASDVEILGNSYPRLCDHFSPLTGGIPFEWSPTGQQIAYILFTHELYIVNVPEEISPEQNVQSHKIADNVFRVYWSPNGQQLAIAKEENGGLDIYILDISTGDTIPLTNSRESSVPLWSPDAQKMAYVSGGYYSPLNLVISLVANGQQIFSTSVGEDGWIIYPSWSPDSQSLVFQIRQGGEADNYEQLHLVHLIDNKEINLSPAEVCDIQPKWSPSGENLGFISNRSGDWEMFTMKPDGSQVRQLTIMPEVEYDFDWSPTSQELAFLAGKSAPPAQLSSLFPSIDSLHFVNLITGEISDAVITSNSEMCCFNSVRWSPAGDIIAFMYRKTEFCQLGESCDWYISLFDINSRNRFDLAKIPDLK